MKAEILARELRAIARRGGGFGSETEAALNALADAFEAQPDALVKPLIAKLKPRAKKAAAPKSVTFDTPAEGVVAQFVERLKSAPNAAAGLIVVGELAQTRGAPASVPQVKEIAGRYLGARFNFSSKKAALDAVKERLQRKDWDRSVLEGIAERAKF